MDVRDLLFFSLGAGIGIAAYVVHQSNDAPKSFEECFLAESKGRQESTFRLVTTVCRQRFPRPPVEQQ